MPLDGSAMGAGKMAFLLRFPVGVVAGITPFNAPFNLACHKIAPALAAGNTIVLKAPPQSPRVVSKLVRALRRRGHARRLRQRALRQHASDRRWCATRAWTSSPSPARAASAREIKAASGLRRVALELGGNGTTIVHADADVAEAAALCARNAMRLAGQSCISVQNVYGPRERVRRRSSSAWWPR